MRPVPTPEDHTSGLTGGPEPVPESPRPVSEGDPTTADDPASADDPTSADGTATAGDTATADGPEQSAPAERRLRLQLLAGVTVHGSDGETVGRVRDVYQKDAGSELAAITVMPRQLSLSNVLIPAVAISSLPPEREEAGAGAAKADGKKTDSSSAQVIQLLVDAETARAGMHPPVTGHATPQDLQDAAAALGLTAEPTGA